MKKGSDKMSDATVGGLLRHAKDELQRLKDDIRVLNSNIDEAEKLIDLVKTKEDFDNLTDFDIGKGLKIIELFF